MNKKIVLLATLIIIGILTVSVVYAFNSQHYNVKKTSVENNNNISKINDSNNVEKKYYCSSCKSNHNLPTNQYHKYKICNVCGKSMKTSHSHNSHGNNYYTEKQTYETIYQSNGHHSQNQHH